MQAALYFVISEFLDQNTVIKSTKSRYEKDTIFLNGLYISLRAVKPTLD